MRKRVKDWGVKGREEKIGKRRVEGKRRLRIYGSLKKTQKKRGKREESKMGEKSSMEEKEETRIYGARKE